MLDLEKRTMHRLTARVLLFFLATSTWAPFLQALSAEPPHACCLRKLHARNENSQRVSDAAPRPNNCCPPLTTPHSAQILAYDVGTALLHVSELKTEPANFLSTATPNSNHSGRAPPLFSIS
jgi:hypothetical protein